MAVGADGLIACESASGQSASSGAGSGSAGVARSVFNFTTLIIGGGLLGWPNTFKLCGWLGGTCCLFVCCLFAETTMCLMVNCGIACKTLSYEETCCAIWGRAGYYIITVTCYLMDFGVLVTYWVALGDLVAPLAKEAFGTEDKARIRLCLAAVMLLPSYLRNLGKIKGWSYINYLLIVFGLVSMLCLAFRQETADFNRDHFEPRGEPVQPDHTAVKPAIWPSIGTLAFTFCNHDSVFMVYANLKDGSWQRWAVVCKLAMWLTVLLMVTTGLPIYLALGDKVASDITTNFPDGGLMRAARVALAVVVAMTWIYLQQVARKYLHSLVMPLVRRRALTPEESYSMSAGELVFFTSVQFGTTLALGICIEDLGLPMALTGVFAQALAAFVIPPGLLFTCALRGDAMGYSRPAQAYFAVVCLFGLVSCTLGVQSTLSSYSKGSGR